MSDDDEIIRLKALLTRVATAAYHDKLIASVGQYPGETKFYAHLAVPDRDGRGVDGDGVTAIEALRNLRNALRSELVRRRDECDKAIAMLEGGGDDG